MSSVVVGQTQHVFARAIAKQWHVAGRIQLARVATNTGLLAFVTGAVRATAHSATVLLFVRARHSVAANTGEIVSTAHAANITQRNLATDDAAIAASVGAVTNAAEVIGQSRPRDAIAADAHFPILVARQATVPAAIQAERWVASVANARVVAAANAAIVKFFARRRDTVTLCVNLKRDQAKYHERSEGHDSHLIF